MISAIDNLYSAFAGVDKPDMIQACPCCMTADEVEALLAKPLRDLSADELSSYGSSALLTVGDVPDYLYFLPRILEISILDDSWWPDIEVSGSKIRMTNPTSWPTTRLNALSSFFDAAIESLIESKNYYRLDDWICGIAAAELEVSRHLAKIEADAAAVVEYFNANSKCLNSGKLCNAFWETTNLRHAEIVQWFKSEKVVKILYDAYGYKV